MDESELDKALDLAQLRLADVLDLLGHVLQVELVRQVATGSGEPAQRIGLLLRPGVDVLVIEAAAIHGSRITRKRQESSAGLTPASGAGSLRRGRMRPPMPEPHDARETRSSAERDADIFARLPAV